MKNWVSMLFFAGFSSILGFLGYKVTQSAIQALIFVVVCIAVSWGMIIADYHKQKDNNEKGGEK